MKYVRIPASRVGVLIGPGGKTKLKLEELSGCDISIDSDEGLFEIIKGNGKDALKNLQVINTAKAIGRGFSPEIAFQILEMEYYFEIAFNNL